MSPCIPCLQLHSSLHSRPRWQAADGLLRLEIVSLTGRPALHFQDKFSYHLKTLIRARCNVKIAEAWRTLFSIVQPPLHYLSQALTLSRSPAPSCYCHGPLSPSVTDQPPATTTAPHPLPLPLPGTSSLLLSGISPPRPTSRSISIHGALAPPVDVQPISHITATSGSWILHSCTSSLLLSGGSLRHTETASLNLPPG